MYISIQHVLWDVHCCLWYKSRLICWMDHQFGLLLWPEQSIQHRHKSFSQSPKTNQNEEFCKSFLSHCLLFIIIIEQLQSAQIITISTESVFMNYKIIFIHREHRVKTELFNNFCWIIIWFNCLVWCRLFSLPFWLFPVPLHNSWDIQDITMDSVMPPLQLL